MSKVLDIADKEEEKFLCKKTKRFDFTKHSREEIADLVAQMKQIMEDAKGANYLYDSPRSSNR